MQVPKRSNAVSAVRTPNSLQRFHQNKIEQADAMLSKSSPLRAFMGRLDASQMRLDIG